MTVDRIAEGYKLYQKGYVKFKAETNGFYEFEVLGSKPRKKGEPRPVYYINFMDFGAIHCPCPDFKRNAERYGEPFYCKHIVACFFKLAELKGVGQQVTLTGAVDELRQAGLIEVAK